jgi:hypothetical protein
MRIVYKMVGGRTMNGRAKNTDSLINRTNVMGGPKKQGLAPTVGLNASVSGVYLQRLGCPCPPEIAYANIVKNISCGTNIGARVVKPRC